MSAGLVKAVELKCWTVLGNHQMGDNHEGVARCSDVLADLRDISNVCIFMADALRWDHLPTSIRERGFTVKTIASSLTTHTSLPSMLTGLWPKHHGVLSWHHRIPEVTSLLSLAEFDSGYYMPGGDNVLDDGTFKILDLDERRGLSELATPWTYFERHHGGHAPFHAAGWEGTWSEFESAFAGDPAKHREWYQRAIEGTVDDFERRLNTLEDRDELGETLVVFTSDHGEYLGEDGLVDHTSPVLPEAIYVPTVFIHPDIEGAVEAAGIMRHVDLLPTILGILDLGVPDSVDGVDVSTTTPEHGYSLSTANVYAFGGPRRTFEAASVWDANGGHVINRTTWPRRVLTAAGLLVGTDWKSRHLRRTPSNVPKAVGHYLHSHETFGTPGFGLDQARDIVDDVENVETMEEIPSGELDEATKARLRELGYL